MVLISNKTRKEIQIKTASSKHFQNSRKAPVKSIKSTLNQFKSKDDQFRKLKTFIAFSKTAARKKTLRSKMDQSPQATLQNLDLWEKFVSLPNEMVVTSKKGRNMFPIVKVNISGLDPRSLYKIKLEFIEGKKRYSYINGEWHMKGSPETSKG